MTIQLTEFEHLQDSSYRENSSQTGFHFQTNNLMSNCASVLYLVTKKLIREIEQMPVYESYETDCCR